MYTLECIAASCRVGYAGWGRIINIGSFHAKVASPFKARLPPSCVMCLLPLLTAQWNSPIIVCILLTGVTSGCGSSLQLALLHDLRLKEFLSFGVFNGWNQSCPMLAD
jgi:hypothetical protein